MKDSLAYLVDDSLSAQGIAHLMARVVSPAAIAAIAAAPVWTAGQIFTTELDRITRGLR